MNASVFGQTEVGGYPIELPANEKIVARFVPPKRALISHISVYLDGQGSGVGAQSARGLIYRAGSDEILAESDEVVVADGQAAGWVEFRFTENATGVLVPANAEIDLGIHGGANGKTIRLRGADPGTLYTAGVGFLSATNVITDAIRAARLSGDGRAPDSSFGIYPGTTNQNFNSGAITNTANTVGYGLSTPHTRETGFGFFGSTCFKVTRGNVAGHNGFSSNQVAATPGQVWTEGVWLTLGTASATDTNVGIEEYSDAGGTVFLRRTSANVATGATRTVVLDGRTWYFVPVTATLGASTVTIRQVVYHNGGGGGGATEAGETFWADGLQLEQKPYPTPLVPTDGSAQTRNDSRLIGESRFLNTTHGYFVARVRPTWPSTADLGYNPRIFEWRDSDNDRMLLYYERTGDQWSMLRRTAAGATERTSGAQTFAAEDEITVAGMWTPTAVYISINGGAWTNTANTQIPALAASTFDIGSQNGTGIWLGGEILWAVAGGLVGGDTPLTNAEIAALHAYGDDGPPGFSVLPGLPTMLWGADTTGFTTTDAGRRNVDTYGDGASATFGAYTPLDRTLSIFATYFPAWLPPENETDFYYGRLPWPEAQSLFGTGLPVADTRRRIRVGWHGSKFDRQEGAFAVVRKGSEIAELLGERVKVTVRGGLRPKVAYVYIHNESDLLDEDTDLSLTRQAFSHLGLLSADFIAADVEVMA